MKLDELVDWYSTLTPETIPRISEIYHEDARFRDPFNDVYGYQAIAIVFEHMFETTENPAFKIMSTQKDGNIAWVSWTFNFLLRGKALSIEGVTRLDFGPDGRVVIHRDYWDAMDLFIHFPLVGALLRYLKRRISYSEPNGVEKRVNQ